MVEKVLVWSGLQMLALLFDEKKRVDLPFLPFINVFFCLLEETISKYMYFYMSMVELCLT